MASAFSARENALEHVQRPVSVRDVQLRLVPAALLRMPKRTVVHVLADVKVLEHLGRSIGKSVHVDAESLCPEVVISHEVRRYVCKNSHVHLHGRKHKLHALRQLRVHKLDRLRVCLHQLKHESVIAAEGLAHVTHLRCIFPHNFLDVRLVRTPRSVDDKVLGVAGWGFVWRWRGHCVALGGGR